MIWRRQVAILSMVALVATPAFYPALLAFPYVAQSNGDTVYSESQIDQAAIDRVTARANKLIATSPLAAPTEAREIFLTDGGWRWTWLAVRFRNAFAVSRPLSEPLIFNRSDPARDKLFNGRSAGAVRSLSGTIAHETCHGMIRRQFGLTSDWTKPAWLREGYCDHVAGESALSVADAERLKVTEPDHPALPYYFGRKRVAAELARNGGDVRALFAAH